MKKRTLLEIIKQRMEEYKEKQNIYFLLATNEDITKKMFTIGAVIQNNSLEESLVRDKSFTEDSLLIEAISSNCRYVYEIKIPKTFYGSVNNFGKIVDQPLPLLTPSEQYDENHVEIKVLDSAYVYGVYDHEKERFEKNPGYQGFHNPRGAHYTNEQLEMFKYDMFEYEQACDRNSKSYFELTQGKVLEEDTKRTQ
jgi:hypothetical protein